MAIELERIEAKARRSYERTRVVRAVGAASPAIVPILLVELAGHASSWLPIIGVALYSTGGFLLWRGQHWGRGVLPGAAAGIIPLVLALCAMAFPYTCSSAMCTSICVASCVAGGILAGGAVGWFAVRTSAKPAFLLSASGIAVLVGALGCSCVGAGGVLGLLGGLLVAVLPYLPRLAATGRG
jgi:hypothetical protein